MKIVLLNVFFTIVKEFSVVKNCVRPASAPLTYLSILFNFRNKGYKEQLLMAAFNPLGINIEVCYIHFRRWYVYKTVLFYIF